MSAYPVFASLRHVCAAFVLLACLCGPVGAANVADLNSASVIVADQGDAEQARGLKQALEQVLVKLSGSRSIVLDPSVKQAVRDPLKYVSQFSYASDDRGGQRLNAEFDADAVSDLLLGNSLPIWQSERPTVLFWLAIESEGQRQLIGTGSHPGIESMLADNMQRRGLPYLLPLLDLDDRSLVSVAEVWGGFRDVIQVASVRYSPEAIVVGRLFPVAGGWRGHWSLINADGSEDAWDSDSAEAEAVITVGVDGLADSLGRVYATRIDNSRRAAVTLAVSNVSGVEDYARVLSYLESLQFVDRVSIHEVRGANISFDIQYRGQLDDIRLIIERGRVLQESASARFSFNYDTLSYSLIP